MCGWHQQYYHIVTRLLITSLAYAITSAHGHILHANGSAHGFEEEDRSRFEEGDRSGMKVATYYILYDNGSAHGFEEETRVDLRKGTGAT